MIEIDISGPQGNAYALMGCVQQWGKDLGWSRAEVKVVIDEMMSGNYDNLCQTVEKHFGDYVELVK